MTIILVDSCMVLDLADEIDVIDILSRSTQYLTGINCNLTNICDQEMLGGNIRFNR